MGNFLTKKLSKKARIIIVVVAFVFLVGLLIIYWAPWKIKDEGYMLIEKDITNSLDTPTSYKLNSAYYKNDVTNYTLNLSEFNRQYKISFSCQNALGNTVNVCWYYGYNTKTHELHNYKTNSTYYNNATFDPVQVK